MGSRIAFFIMLTLVFLYSYVLGGQGSMIILYLLLLSFVVSTILTLLVKRKVYVNSNLSKAQIEKGGTVSVSVYLENKSCIPIPFVDISFIKVPNFKLSDSSTIRISLGAHENQTITIIYTAKIRGVAQIGIRNIELRDYLGLFKFTILKAANNYDFARAVSVIPRIHSIRSNSKIIINSNKSQMQDDFGGSTLIVGNSTGEPGYEFREYVPGDSLHKIHWKLSAKKDILLVRTSEAQVIRKKTLIIDPCIDPIIRTGIMKMDYDSISEERLLMEELILESVLSIAHTMIKASIEVELYIYEKAQWVRYPIKDTNSISQLQHKLAEYRFIDTLTFNLQHRIPLLNISGGEALIFTGALDETLSDSINQYLNCNILVETILIKKSSESDKSFVQENLWVLNINKDFTEVFS